MQLALIGLGKMGANMTRRLLRKGIKVVGYNRSQEIVKEFCNIDGFSTASDIDGILKQLTAPKIVWLMLPSGDVTEQMLLQLSEKMSAGDIIIDGGNANYHDSQRRSEMLLKNNINFVDAGVSGGVWGNENGYCVMVGGNNEVVQTITPILQKLAPEADRGWAHVGPVGAGHFSKMIHNGIEYGMMQSFAEGFALLKGKNEFDFDPAKIAELWRHSSVVRSWLLDLMAEFLQHDQQLSDVSPYVTDSGEGRWTVEESIAQGIPTPVLALALHMRFASQDNYAYGNRLLSKMRQAFGGHQVFKNNEQKN